ncbi:hypothetical protein TNCV_2274361 [Trichonephila clavipes]|nr:hypothetical protein TNCV_2274361 [Trichonephila clavipes]
MVFCSKTARRFITERYTMCVLEAMMIGNHIALDYSADIVNGTGKLVTRQATIRKNYPNLIYPDNRRLS